MPTDALTAQLSVLTAALDDPGTDLETILEVLVDDLSAAVSSFLGLTMTLQLDGCALTLTTMDADLALTAGASLTLPVGRSTDGAPGGTVVFYARHPGAFVDLAADLHRVHDLDCDVYLDGHLPSAGDQPCRSGITGLAELSVVNQAIGVLITRGYTPAGAIAELGSRAAGTPRGVPEVAEHVLASTNAPPPDRSLATASRSVADRGNPSTPRRGAGVGGPGAPVACCSRVGGTPTIRTSGQQWNELEVPVMGTKVGNKVGKAGDSALLEGLARVGLIAYGVVHLLIGWLALQIAWGGTSGGSADSSGALTTVADQPFGKILLWLVAVGMVALALWQASEAIWGYHNRSGGKRVRKQVSSAAKAALYAALGVSAALVAVGAGSSSSQSQQEATSGVLAWPGGQVIVVVAALVIIGVGVAGVVKGVKKSFAEEIDTSSMSPAAQSVVARLGQVGYVARGLALGVVGGLLGYAALTFDAQQAKGLDGAMRTILEQPFGQFLLTAVALGFVAFGLFAFLQARYRRM